MPPVSRLMVRAALAHLGLGFTLGALVMLAKANALPTVLWAFRDAHVHMLFVGWMVQLACGVAFWILPRLDAAGERGPAWPIALGAALLNLGVGLVLVDGVSIALTHNDLPIAREAAGACYLAAAVALVSAVWGRVLAFRSLPRP